MSARKRRIMETGRDAAGAFSAIGFYLFGPLIWAGHLALVYGPQSAVCAFGEGSRAADVAVQWLLTGVTLASFVAIAGALAFPGLLAALLRFRGIAEGERRFATTVMRLLAALSLAGVAWAGTAGFFLDPCAQLR